MKKRSTPEQVKKSKVLYTFEDFLNDLWEDIKSTLSKEYSKKMSDKEQRDVFKFVYELCYLAVMNHPELELTLEKADAENKGIVQKTLISNKENIALLRAIFMREITNRLEQGLTKRQAVKATIEESKSVLVNWMN
jgi:hypothetical protein